MKVGERWTSIKDNSITKVVRADWHDVIIRDISGENIKFEFIASDDMYHGFNTLDRNKFVKFYRRVY